MDAPVLTPPPRTLGRKSATLADIWALPEDARAELIDGRMYMMAPPQTAHQKISMELSRVISNYIHDNGGDCEVFAAPFGVYAEDNDHDFLEPDISVICDPSKITEKGCNGAPDWIIEIVSPSSRKHDYIRKLAKYAEFGVREYWIVDQERDQIYVYRNLDGTEYEQESYTFADTVKAGIYSDLAIDFAAMN